MLCSRENKGAERWQRHFPAASSAGSPHLPKTSFSKFSTLSSRNFLTSSFSDVSQTLKFVHARHPHTLCIPFPLLRTVSPFLSDTLCAVPWLLLTSADSSGQYFQFKVCKSVNMHIHLVAYLTQGKKQNLACLLLTDPVLHCVDYTIRHMAAPEIKRSTPAPCCDFWQPATANSLLV